MIKTNKEIEDQFREFLKKEHEDTPGNYCNAHSDGMSCCLDECDPMPGKILKFINSVRINDFEDIENVLERELEEIEGLMTRESIMQHYVSTVNKSEIQKAIEELKTDAN